MKRRLLCIPVLSAGAALLAASPSLAATATDAVASGNWSGYVASGQQFSKVSGSWVQPAAKCESGTGDAAFWVGIGGASGGSSGLEQAGSEVDCSDGSPRYSAWYELVPDGPVTVDLPVSAGDKISASVGVEGNQVSIALTNQTSGRSFTKTLEMDNPDTSSAEWIAEAPSQCQGSALGECQTVPLADFGSISFGDATATAGGQTQTAAQWGAQAVQLSPTAQGGFDVSSESTATASAVPSTLDGGSFSVAWQASDAGQNGGYGQGGYGSDPYGASDPYGGSYGDGGGSGYDGGGGYGYDGSGGYGYDGGGGYGYGGGGGYDGGGGYGYGGYGAGDGYAFG